MRLLVTGGTGFLGSHLCRRFASEGHCVTVFRRQTSSISMLANLNIHYEIGDISDIENVNRAIKDQQVVIHAAYDRHRVSQCRTQQLY